MHHRRRVRIQAVSLPRPARCRTQENRSRVARRPDLPRAGGPRNWDREQGRGVPPPRPRARHGGCEPPLGIPRGPPLVQVRCLRSPRARREIGAVDDEQPREDRATRGVRRAGLQTDPAADPPDGHEPSVSRHEEGPTATHPRRAPGQRRSITATTRSAGIVSPSVALRRRTTPSCGAGISFCIFIASRTRRVCPRFTWAPGAIRTRTTRPGIEDRTSIAVAPLLAAGAFSSRSSATFAIEIVWRRTSIIAWRPSNRIRSVPDPLRTVIPSVVGLVLARYRDPSTETEIPFESRDRSISRSSPSTTSRIRMRTSREPVPTPRERPPGRPEALDRVRRAGLEAAVRREGRGNRHNPLLPRSSTLHPFRDA